MQTLQLFIDGTQADMFKDESVQLTQTIQNVKDIGSIFTDFSRTFNLPASKTNNKIFKHYYDWTLRNTSSTPTFDANNTIAAEIELNNQTFKKGFIALNGAKLKNNKVYTYEVTFFGETISLKKELKETKLTNIFQSITTYDHEYSTSNVVDGLETSLVSGAIRYPLIVNGTGTETFGSNRLFYNSSSHSRDSNNLYFSGSGQGAHNQGVKKSMLKPALKVSKIIEAIEDQTSLEFTKTATDDFFNTSENEIYDSLYLWLSRTKGNIGLNVTGTEGADMPITNIDLSDPANPAEFPMTGAGGGEPEYALLENGIFSCKTVNFGNFEFFEFYDIIFRVESTSAYSMFIEEITGETQVRASKTVQENAGQQAISYIVQGEPDTGISEIRSFRLRITSTDTSITFSPIVTFRLTVGERDYDEVTEQDFDNRITAAYITPNGAVSNIVVADQVPDIKVIDFLTGLFKMFNLTAFVQDDGKIKVQTLDTFYDGAEVYDISEFVDTNESSVDFAIPYQEIAFRFQEPKTFLPINFQEINNRIFGNLENTTVLSEGVQTTDRGNKYVVPVPFGKMLYERLTDIDDGSNTPFQYGYCTDKDQNETNIQPLILAIENIDVSTDRLSFQDGSSSGRAAGLTSYNRPVNVIEVNGSKQSINFGEEVDEFSGEAVENSLFFDYYRNYIIDVFNKRRRLTKVTAYLPLRILLKYTLADTFRINGKDYKINSINTDFMTGKSDLELLNIL